MKIKTYIFVVIESSLFVWPQARADSISAQYKLDDKWTLDDSLRVHLNSSERKALTGTSRIYGPICCLLRDGNALGSSFFFTLPKQETEVRNDKIEVEISC